MIIWPEAQRPSRGLSAQKIANEFDFDKLGAIVVSRRLAHYGGKHHVIDGWTRCVAMRIYFGEDVEVPCLITEASTSTECAKMFRGINGTRTKPTAMEMFLVGVTEGAADVVAIQDIVEKCGLHITHNVGSGMVRAVGELATIYRQRDGADLLRRTLLLIQDTWDKDPSAYDAVILKSAARFLANRPDADLAIVARKMAKKWQASAFIGSVKSLKEAMGRTTADAGAEIIASIYDTNRRKS